MTEKRNIHALIEKEAPSLNNLLDPNEVKEFKELTNELRDTWTKKQVFRTETEMRMSVLQDAKYPTKASKYWQCVREQNVFLENLMSLSFDARRNEVKLKKLSATLSLFKIALAFPNIIAITLPLDIFFPSLVFKVKIIFLSEYLNAFFAKPNPAIIQF